MMIGDVFRILYTRRLYRFNGLRAGQNWGAHTCCAGVFAFSWLSGALRVLCAGCRQALPMPILCRALCSTGRAAGQHWHWAGTERGAAKLRTGTMQATPGRAGILRRNLTALPESELAACLDLAREALEQGWISSFRCSTRPDRVDAPTLLRLRKAGCMGGAGRAKL